MNWCNWWAWERLRRLNSRKVPGARAGETLCAFLNGQGGRVLIGVTDQGKITGQAVTDTTLQGVAEILRRLEPAVYIPLIPVLLPGSERQVLVLEAWPVPGKQPYVFDGRAYRRIGTTTSVMPQDQYQTMLLARSHSQQRWEHAGEGRTQTIVQLCLQAGHPEPEFIEQAGAVGVRFPIHGYIPPQRVGHDLTQRQRSILQILSHGTASLREVGIRERRCDSVVVIKVVTEMWPLFFFAGISMRR